MKKLIELSSNIAFVISMIAGACLDSESIIFPIILFLSFSWLLTSQKILDKMDE